MTFHIVTLFPKAFDSYLNESILKRAIKDRKIKVRFYNPRDFTKDKWRRIDRKPFGGGPGMVIEAVPVIKAVAKATAGIKNKELGIKIVWLSPGGKQFTNQYAEKVRKSSSDIIIICGRYEGIDSRIKKVFKVDEISVGPYVLTGGELPAMIIIDAISRRVPGVLGDNLSVEENRVSSHDVYTRPEIFEYKGKKYKVPKVLLSGHHKKIEEWKKRYK
ncbi:MAG: tRNA (guanosine(37)-N1)-methyltransferase TrmD [Candidatus Zambryskibacteria bacterium RIFCSPHIGHO2_01_FULL_43_25]|uniref:tRNA (guanine-N(1)-)-methyltransferase n=1 Tax=Candidatus Zambryskibacteria bacterium RIFCSPLOWO2_01_FULL_45_21 TaxID=1802761 RepID=A0A1G2U5G8_9BACT|nr:MAG: tRNA (guanosine(37)-N1)-methyltransferase TrmD [Candidatus Zambryskibacteria bacterium RIFCSPHIGHO2_01_FULL_43_25]OHB00385.1 MAG: tRNA (guanosine(37)-N1)-methyltransferase TrmD [Candidatus Zambryskibacteria bacterium RIFCSPHIGHO2_12_FULL_44_12b]OHB04180.1 MAG: tRNA (guanosine(37)-N1)-methyltransferase TrmD [Candidatus Zambryskibacteria bacterium RIFCSPLOWO2_01_FULL_45_21]